MDPAPIWEALLAAPVEPPRLLWDDDPYGPGAQATGPHLSVQLAPRAVTASLRPPGVGTRSL